MSDERELIIYWLRILYSSNNHIESVEEQHENIDNIKRLIELNPVLNHGERLLLAHAYKNPISSRRSAIRHTSAIIQKMDPTALDKPVGDPSLAPAIRRMREFLDKLYTEMREIALDVINLIDTSLIDSASEPEERVFYEKMKGDYLRYICENRNDPEFEMLAQKARVAYQTALDIAQAELSPTSSDYLGLVLNFSVFLYETLQCQSDAIELSQRTFNESIDMVDVGEEGGYAAADLLDLLRENHTRWIKIRDQSAP